MAEVIALEITEGDNTEYGRVEEVIMNWTDVETGLEYVMITVGRDGYALTLEADEHVRIYA